MKTKYEFWNQTSKQKQNALWCAGNERLGQKNKQNHKSKPFEYIRMQARIAADLIELRNKSVFAFFMANALFVLIVFLLQLNKDKLHIVWPLGVKTNITYIEETSEVFIKTKKKNVWNWIIFNHQIQSNTLNLFVQCVTIILYNFFVH